jgi:hypothetical protein
MARGVCPRSGNQEVARSTIIAQIKMEDACILYNVIEIFWQRKVINIESEGSFVFLRLQMWLAQLCKNTSAYLYKHSIISIASTRNWSMGVNCDSSFFGLSHV